MASASHENLLVGDGRGMLLSYDLVSGKLKYGLGASATGPVKSVVAVTSARKVITAGEDGKAMIFSYAH